VPARRPPSCRSCTRARPGPRSSLSNPAAPAPLSCPARQADIDRTDPGCEADPFAFLRFACRHAPAACLERVPALRRAALASVAPGAPPSLLRHLAAGAAGRVDAEGPGVVRALLEALPEGDRSSAAWLMLPHGCRSARGGAELRRGGSADPPA
jgi:hypothetical protein